MTDTDVIGLLARAYDTDAAMLGTITPAAFDAASPCAAWTVRQAGNHLVGSLLLLARVAEGEEVGLADYDGGAMAATDHLGQDPVGALRAAADRSLRIFGRPDVLGRTYSFAGQPTPGAILAQSSLMEALVHGWDVAQGADAPFPADKAVVDAVREFSAMAIGDGQRAAGLFASAVPTSADADPLTTLLGHLGRRAQTGRHEA